MAIEFKNFDTRNYPTVDVVEGYSIWARSYDVSFDGDLDLPLLNGIQSIPWSQIKTVADLACGTGRTGQWVLGKGATQLDGVDLTEEMISRARQREIYRTLLNEDIRKTSLPSESYDLVMNSLSAEHLPYLPPLFQEAFRLARPSGYFILLGYHPHFQLRGIPTHFDEGDSQKSIAIQNHIHLLSDFVKAGLDTHWTLTELTENRVTDDWAQRSAGMKKHLGHPISFVGVWRKKL